MAALGQRWNELEQQLNASWQIKYYIQEKYSQESK